MSCKQAAVGIVQRAAVRLEAVEIAQLENARARSGSQGNAAEHACVCAVSDRGEKQHIRCVAAVAVPAGSRRIDAGVVLCHANAQRIGWACLLPPAGSLLPGNKALVVRGRRPVDQLGVDKTCRLRGNTPTQLPQRCWSPAGRKGSPRPHRKATVCQHDAPRPLMPRRGHSSGLSCVLLRRRNPKDLDAPRQGAYTGLPLRLRCCGRLLAAHNNTSTKAGGISLHVLRSIYMQCKDAARLRQTH